MLRKIVVAAICGACIGFVNVAPAVACSSGGGVGCGGGNVFTWERGSYYMPGEVAVGTTTFSWSRGKKGEAGGPENGPYYVYLRPENSKFRISAADDPSAIPVGVVDIEDARKRAAVAHVRFTIPAIRGGYWIVDTCDATCEHPLGDVLDTPILIVADEVEERELLSRRLNALGRSVGRARALAVRTKIRLRRDLRDADADLHGELAQLDYDVYKLTRRVEELSRREPDDNLSAGTMLAAGAITGGGISLGGITMWRRRRKTEASGRSARATA